MSNGTEMTTTYNISNHEVLLAKKKDDLDKWMLPAGNLRADALVRFALHEMQTNPMLQACTPASIYLALLACAVTGLVPGKLRGLAYLIPFKNTRKVVDAQGNGREIETMEATFMVGWKGIKLMGFRAGLDLVSAVIHEGDDFSLDKGTNPSVRYSPALRGAGAVIGTAAWVKLPRGGLEAEYLDLDTLGKIEAFAKSKSGGKSPAWDGPFKDQMQRKSALRRLGTQIGMGEDFHRAEILESDDGGGGLAAALDEITDGEASRGAQRQLAEAAAFGEAPRVQVQVPPVPTVAAKNGGGFARAGRPSASAPTSASTPLADAGRSPGASSTPAVASPPSKLDAAVKAVEAKGNPTQPSSSTAPPASTASVSPEATPTETSSSVPVGEATGFAEAAVRAFDSFEDPVDSAPPKSVDGFRAWLAGIASEEDLKAGVGEWMDWTKSLKGTPGWPDIFKAMKDLYDAKYKDLAKARAR